MTFTKRLKLIGDALVGREPQRDVIEYSWRVSEGLAGKQRARDEAVEKWQLVHGRALPEDVFWIASAICLTRADVEALQSLEREDREVE